MIKYYILLLCTLLLPLTGCRDDDSKLHGYVEGEYVYLASTTPGILKALSVQRGDEVKAGQDLFAIDTTELTASISVAEAEVAHANANLQNIVKGKRGEEINVILKQKAHAQAILTNAYKDYQRTKSLVESGTLSRAIYDAKKSAFDAAQASVDELTAQLKVATLGAREDEIKSAQARIDMAAQKLIQAKKQGQDAAPKAPADAQIENTFFRVGEFVGAGKPVISLLPPENIKIRFFVAQKLLPMMTYGKTITVGCDGCTKSIEAKITYISTQAEYTPPIIYSNESRQKLVFMVEATPSTSSAILRPGLPVDIQVHAP